MRILTLLATTALTAASLCAQLAPPNAAGVSLGHIHFIVTNPDATKKAWVDVFGATPEKSGALDMLKIPGIFLIVSKANAPTGGPSMASVVHHIGVSVKDYAATKAKADAEGLPWRELTKDVQAFVTFPEGVTVEVMENKDQAAPVMFHHIHESVTDPATARAWYVKEFGAAEGQRRGPSAMFPGGEIDFMRAQLPAAHTKGRSLDHIGFEVKDLAATLKKLNDDGVAIDMPLRDMTKQLGLKIAFITDPNGTRIELTEGLISK